MVMMGMTVPTFWTTFSVSADKLCYIGSVVLDNWPVENKVVAVELEKMKPTHWTLPVPTYNLENQLIHPANYCHELQSTLVKIHFTLLHCSFKIKDAFTADIHSVQVLHTPHTVSFITKHQLPSSFEHPNPSTASSFMQGKAVSLSKKT